MTTLEKEKLMAQARGCWQRDIVATLISHGEIRHPIYDLRGKAANYSGHYRESMDNLFRRLEGAGARITWIPGERGGVVGSRYKLSI